jgi:isoaspartyl peptidase/L-asparaginase-like protein (Ntn-hydrolase superfamily)
MPAVFLVVELMRHGRTPQQACREAVMRIVKRNPKAAKEIQVGFLAIAPQRRSRRLRAAERIQLRGLRCEESRTHCLPAASVY